MSNKVFQKPLGLPGNVPPPPPLAPPTVPSAILEKYPLPWCVGPYGDIWVAADVELVADADKISYVGLVDGKWRATCSNPRRIAEPTDKGLAELIVGAVNAIK